MRALSLLGAPYNKFVCVAASLKEEETVLETEIDISEMKLYREQMPILKDTKEKYQILEL